MTASRHIPAAVRRAVLERDRQCFLRHLEGVSHVCHGQWGEPHSSYALDMLTLDHVQETCGMMGKRTPPDNKHHAEHLVAICWSGNSATYCNGKVVMGSPSAALRQAEREYLAEFYG